MVMKSSMPDGYHSITPYFTVRDANKLIEFGDVPCSVEKGEAGMVGLRG